MSRQIVINQQVNKKVAIRILQCQNPKTKGVEITIIAIIIFKKKIPCMSSMPTRAMLYTLD